MYRKFKKKEGFSMAYCTNCGKETSAKKVCEHCGVKKNKTHNFCEWCGTALDQKAKVCPNCQEPKKVGTIVGKAISTFFAVLFLILALGSIGESFLAGICFLLFALLLLPFTKGLIRKATHNNMKLRKTLKPIRVIVLVVLFLVGGSALPESDTNYAEQHWNALTAPSEKEIDEMVRKQVKADLAGYVQFQWGSGYIPEVYISSMMDEEDGVTIYYTVYGKLTVTDPYGDEYTGKFTGKYFYDPTDREVKQTDLDVDTLLKD